MLRHLFKKRPGSPSGAALGRDFAVGDVLEQRFEVEQVRLGFMGIVYIAYDRQRRRRVVLKTFQNKFLWDETAISRFNAEAELWMRLGSHPNIVRAYDLRAFLGKPHVIAEYVHGGPLRTLVGHLSQQEAVDYAIQICWGMSHSVERAAIMHCDLKPDNIMVTLEGQAKVTDFGLARVLPIWQWSQQSRDQTNALPRISSAVNDVLGGTLPYMAPELLDRSPFFGTWSDIYAFGVMLFELLTGKLPFDSMRDESLIRMHLHKPPPDPRELKGQLHKGTAHIINHCLAKRPAERYESFAQVEADLQMLRGHLFGKRYNVAWPASEDNERDRWTERGLLHMDQGEYNEALTCFRQAVGLAPDRTECWLNMARARGKLWQYNEALQALQEGLKRANSRNEFGQLYQAQGEIYAAMLRPGDAAAAYDKGLSYTPNAPGLWRDKGALLMRSEMLREARDCLTQALKYDRLDWLTWQLLGDLEMAQDRARKAYPAYAEALKLNPRSAASWTRYGQCQLKLSKTREAIRSFEAALKLDERQTDAAEGLQLARQLAERK